MNVYEATIPANQPDGKLGVYLLHALPLLPERVLREAFKKRDVKVDGVRTPPDAPIQRGATVRVYTAYEAKLPVLYEDEHILIVNKPAGISADDDFRGGMTVQTVLEAQAKGEYRPRLCHRLDNQTCGLLIAAKDDESEQCLLNAFEERTLTKRYVCLVRGTLRPESAVKDAFLVKDAVRGRVRVVTHGTPEARPIRTGYETLEKGGDISRVRVTLYTGRTHQIRAHMAFLAHPILGDDVYGDRAFNKRMGTTRLMLCAAELTMHTGGILHYLDGKTFSIQPPF